LDELSSLSAISDCLFIVKVGDEPELSQDPDGRIHLIQCSRDIRHFEKATLGLLHTFTKFHDGVRIYTCPIWSEL